MVLLETSEWNVSESFITALLSSGRRANVFPLLQLGGGSREQYDVLLLGKMWAALNWISAVEAFCIPFTAAKFCDSLGKCCGGVLFRGSLKHLAGFRTDFLSALCLTVSKLLASFQAVKLTLQIPRLSKSKIIRAKLDTGFPLASLICILLEYTISRSLVVWLALDTRCKPWWWSWVQMLYFGLLLEDTSLKWSLAVLHN